MNKSVLIVFQEKKIDYFLVFIRFLLTNRLQSGLRVNFSFRSLREIVIIFVLNNWFEEIIELNLSIYFSSSSYLRNEYDYKTVLHLDLEDT